MPDGREIQLAARPTGLPRPGDFALASVPVPDPGPGQVLVRNTWMSVDPYMRPRMDDRPSYVPPFALGAPLDGAAVGEVVASRDPGLPVGTTVSHWLGWRELALLDARAAHPVDTAQAPASAYLGPLGMTGLTAYVGLVDIAELRDGDVVYVSAAAGTVGSLAAQFAKRLGHRVIGSAGGPEKARHLREDLGLDAALDHRAGDLLGQLRAAAPEGIDVYFDNVGGDHLEAALEVLNPRGRVALCGAISAYNATEPPGVHNLFRAVGKRVTLRGFIATDHLAALRPLRERVAPWLADGSLVARETVMDGLARAPEAFIAMLEGANVGKMLVRLGDA